jgi:PhnB protein
MTQLSPYLKFNGNCRKAMEFYQKCLGGELKIQTLGESPMAAQTPAKAKDNVMHATLISGKVELMASDMIGSEGVKKGNTISLSLVGKDTAEIAKFFSKLSEGGEITTPLKEEFFGTYGEIVDQFGVSWMFQADKN